ncbi:cell division protein SepF [Methanobrevibacter sp.]|uniref:cell division protein SepF n=1 Tax=Methanobrevibacter sp. TaxID=66852 RepID=UPI0025EC8F69|nr:cell division protein SepF [Methanobrevibacter sp.]MBQ2666203.1 cell division protein SepF [Methanobrevibacter sp.]
MSFTDDLKRSLGFDETDEKREGPRVIDSIRDAVKPFVDNVGQQINKQQQSRKNQQQYRQNQQQYEQVPKPAPKSNPRPTPKQEPVYDDYDDFVIIPEQSYYEIVLIRPKTIDDINYVVDQVIEEQNPVVLDLSFLEKESSANFKLAGDKIKQMRERYGAQALLLARSDDKNLIIVSPKKVKVINKG